MNEMNTPGAAGAMQSNEPTGQGSLPLKLDVNARPIDPVGNLVGFASVKINDAFVVENIRICTGANGLFVNMPSQQGKDGEYHDIFFPVTADARAQLNSAVVSAYSSKLMSMQATVDAAKDTISRAAEGRPVDKPSVMDTLRQNGEKARQQPPKPGDPNNGQSRF